MLGVVLIHRLDHRRGQRGHRVRMCGSQAQATGRVIGDCRVWSRGLTGSQGPGLTWGPTVQQLHKVGWEGSQLPVLLSQPPAILNLGRREGRRGIWFCPKCLSRNHTLSSAPILPDDPLHLCCLTSPSLHPSPFPLRAPSLNPSPLTQGCAPLFRPNPLITSSPHLLYHFYNLPSLQLQLIRLLRAVVEVHFAPSSGAPRFDRATWDGT